MKYKDKINIIIADDSDVFIEGLRLMFSKKKEYHILDTCKNGLELINNINLSKADLLLIDIEMPKMNGIIAATKLNCINVNLPMIAITMYKEKIYLEDIIKAGFKAFIHKPEVSKSLFYVIEQVLNNEFIFPDNLLIN